MSGSVYSLLGAAVGGRRRDAALFAAWSLVEAVPAALSGRLVAWALDRGFLAGRVGSGLGYLALFALAALIGTWGTRQAFLRLSLVIEPFRDELVRRIVHGSMHRAATAAVPGDGASIARLTQQVEIAREAFGALLMSVQGFIVTAVAASTGLLVLLPAAAPLVAGPLAAGLLMLALALWRLTGRQREVIVADEAVAAGAVSVFGALRDVTAAGGEDTTERWLGRRIDDQARATTRLARITALRTLAVAIGGWLPVVLILVRGDWLLRHGATAGAIVGALMYVLRGIQPALQQLAGGLGGTGTWLLVTLRRIAQETAPPAPSRPEVARRMASPRDATLELDAVTFAYAPTATPVVEALTLRIEDGEHLAIVGPSGVGKSTLANLCAGLLAPQRGSVRLGGVAMDQLHPQDLAAARALIPQEAHVFRATVRENLTYLRVDVPARELATAIERLGAAPVVARLGGLDAELDPARLSSGERQLLTLVRAYLSPARLVILDEASSHLDPAAEARAEAAFAQRPGSLVVVAHRISSALRAQRVLLLDGGSATAGTHTELLAASAAYRDLVGSWDLGFPRVA